MLTIRKMIMIQKIKIKRVRNRVRIKRISQIKTKMLSLAVLLCDLIIV